MSRYTLSEAAAADLIDLIGLSEERWGDAAARRMAYRLFKAFEGIADGSRRGHRHSQLPDGLSVLCVFERPFLIFFSESELKIVRVVHGRRDVARIFSSDLHD